MAEQRIELAKMIEELANQLRGARDRANSGTGIIDLADCELEVALQVTDEGHGGIKFWALELGGRRSKANSNTIRVRFTPHGRMPIVMGFNETGGLPDGVWTPDTRVRPLPGTAPKQVSRNAVGQGIPSAACDNLRRLHEP
jgi:hypothetical protein